MIDSEIEETSPPVRAETRPRRRALGGAVGNNRLTSLLGLILLVGLAVEGATLRSIHQLLSVHAFVGMLLLGPVAVKLASTGYRFLRYYSGGADYVRLGPPQPLMRFVVAPVLVLSTLTLFDSGVTAPAGDGLRALPGRCRRPRARLPLEAAAFRRRRLGKRPARPGHAARVAAGDLGGEPTRRPGFAFEKLPACCSSNIHRW
jgi:hypothetical protein